MTLQYWFMLPVAISIATIAMAAGVGGATFFSPLFILALGLPPEVAIGTGLITEVFGFASGLTAYARKRLIDYRLGLSLLVAAIPMALIGTIAIKWIDSTLLKVILGIGLFAVALSLLRSPETREIELFDSSIKKEFRGDKAETVLKSRDGEEFHYTVCNRTEGRLIAGIGGLFVGLISTGLGELNGYFLLRRCRVPSIVSIATSVFVVAGTALAASVGHILRFAQADGEVLNTVLSIVIFTVPGVILGGQLGSKLASVIPQKTMEVGLGILFIGVAALTLGEVIL